MLATPRFVGVALTSTWKEAIVVANFKQILAMFLDGASYTRIAHTFGWGLTPDVSIFRGSGRTSACGPDGE